MNKLYLIASGLMLSTVALGATIECKGFYKTPAGVRNRISKSIEFEGKNVGRMLVNEPDMIVNYNSGGESPSGGLPRGSLLRVILYQGETRTLLSYSDTIGLTPLSLSFQDDRDGPALNVKCK